MPVPPRASTSSSPAPTAAATPRSGSSAASAARVHHRLRIIDGFTARVPRRAVRRLAASGAVRSLSRDSRLHVSSTTDPGADAAAATTAFLRKATGADALDAGLLAGAGVDVAVVDSGVVAVGSLAAPGALVRGPDFSNERRVPALAGLDTFGHGTHVAGVIAGRDPLTGYQGVAPGRARRRRSRSPAPTAPPASPRCCARYDWI